MKIHPPTGLFLLAVLASALAPNVGFGQKVNNNPSIVVSNTLFVDPAGSETTAARGTTRAYLTLSQALGDAQPGDTIIMRPGTYNTPAGAVAITQNKLHLVAYGAKLVAASQTDITKIQVVADDVTIEGLEIDGKYVDANNGDSGLIDVSDHANCSILNCYIHHAGSEGIRSVGTCLRLTIDNCRFDNCAQNILLYNAPNDCRITHNEITAPVGPTAGGIRIEFSGGYGGSGYLLEGNRVTGVFLLPIEVWGGHSKYRIVNNTVRGGSAFGISVDNGRDVTVSGNQVYGATFIGIEVATASKHVLITNNVVDGLSESSGSAVTPNLIQLSNVTVTDVTISGNDLRNAVNTFSGAVHLFGASHIQVIGNNFQTDSPCVNVQGTNNVLIEANKFRAATEDSQIPYHVVILDASGNAQMRNVQIIGNTFYAGAVGSFVLFYSSTASVTSGVRITNNTATSVSAGGNAFCNNSYVFNQSGAVSDITIDGNLPALVNPAAAQFGWINTPPIFALPTADPHVQGEAWNNGGVVTLSNG